MFCENCGERIYEGDTYYEIEGKSVCIDCAVDYLDENCKEEDEEGEFYLVDRETYDLDDVNQILLSCETVLEHDDIEPYDPKDEPEYWKE